MKINELVIVPAKNQDTTSCGTTYSSQPTRSAQDIVPQDIVPENKLALEVDSEVLEMPDHSAITEGVSQILRRKPGGGAPTMGFRCQSGPRKGRIVSKPATCFAKLNPKKGAKIKRKRLRRAKSAGVKLGITKRSRAGSVRLKKAQIKRGGARKPVSSKSRTVKAKAPQKSKTIKSKKSKK